MFLKQYAFIFYRDNNTCFFFFNNLELSLKYFSKCILYENICIVKKKRKEKDKSVVLLVYQDANDKLD